MKLWLRRKVSSKATKNRKESQLLSETACVDSHESVSSASFEASANASDSNSKNLGHRGLKAASASLETNKKNYWKQAVEELQHEEPTFQGAIAAVVRAASENGEDLAIQLTEATERSRRILIAKQMKIGLGSKEVIVREQLEKILKAVQLFKDVGSAAAGLDPIHAGLPWAGICVMMQLVTSDFDQYAAMVAGAEEVAPIISRYSHVEMLCVLRRDTTLHRDFEAHLIRLYKCIAKYQVLAACYYQRSTIARFLRSIPQLDDPSHLLVEIRRHDATCKDFGQVLNSYDIDVRHREILAVFSSYDDKVNELLQELRRRDNDFIKEFQAWALQKSIPAKVDSPWKQAPVTLEDSLGFHVPIPLELITSWKLFHMVLSGRFEKRPGHLKVLRMEYTIQDSLSHRHLDQKDEWTLCFRPGQKVEMSMVFTSPNSNESFCPGCKTTTRIKENVEIQCPNPQCGLWYRRVIEIEDDENQDGVSLSGRPNRESVKNGKTAETASSIGVATLKGIEAEDKPSDFRRVSLVSKWNSSTGKYMSGQIAAWKRGMVSGTRVMPSGTKHNVYVGNLPFEYRASDLEKLCLEAALTPVYVNIVKERSSGRSRGFSFIEFPTAQMMDQAIKLLDGTVVRGRTFQCNQARPRRRIA